MDNELTPEELKVLPKWVQKIPVLSRSPHLVSACKLLARKTLELKEAERLMHNCRYWDVTPAQMDVVERLMKTKGKNWPQHAIAILEELQQRFACSGEVFVAAAVDYAKGEV